MMDQSKIPSEVTAIPPGAVTELDVRPVLNAGGEPFGQIMGAIGRVAAGGALKLRAPFRPAPLLHMLGSQGWRHWIERGEGDDWIVWFYRAPSEGAALAAGERELTFLQKENPALRTRLTRQGTLWSLDVRGLSPPEPLELTLAALAGMPRECALVQLNVRVPQLLLPLLAERGFRYSIGDGTGGEVRIEIRHL